MDVDEVAGKFVRDENDEWDTRHISAKDTWRCAHYRSAADTAVLYSRYRWNNVNSLQLFWRCAYWLPACVA